MDSEYLCKHLKNLALLLYEGTVYAHVNEGGEYVFGDEDNKNIVTTKIAMYLACENPIKDEETKTKRTRTKKERE